MRKHIARFLTMAMMLGLFTVSAKAADTYGPYSVTDNMGKVCSFAAAKIETRTMKFCSVDFETLEKTITTVENATVITIQPGSTATVKDMQGAESYMALYAYNNTDDGYELLTGTVQELIGTDTLDSMFGEDAGWDVPVDLLSLTTEEGVEVYILLGNGAVPAPAAPAETEPPAQSVTPVEPVHPVTPSQPVAPTAPTAPSTYTVKEGETMGQIALNFYGSYGYHKALYQANAEAFKATGGKLTPGMVLFIPEKLGKAPLLSAPVAGEGETLYTVKAGDTLSAIAKAVYGDAMKYKAIYERNSDRLKNANTIYVGQIIVLPSK